MTWGGWLFMLLCWFAIVSLSFFAFSRILKK